MYIGYNKDRKNIMKSNNSWHELSVILSIRSEKSTIEPMMLQVLNNLNMDIFQIRTRCERKYSKTVFLYLNTWNHGTYFFYFHRGLFLCCFKYETMKNDYVFNKLAICIYCNTFCIRFLILFDKTLYFRCRMKSILLYLLLKCIIFFVILSVPNQENWQK